MPRYCKFIIGSGEGRHRSLCRPRMKNTATVSTTEANEQTPSGFGCLIASMEPDPTIDGHVVVVDKRKLPAELRAVAHVQLILTHRDYGICVFECVAHSDPVNDKLPENSVTYLCITNYQHPSS